MMVGSERVGHTVIEVWEGDFRGVSCDALVNSANGSLRHDGGLARAICRAAGGVRYQQECDAAVRANRGPFRVGTVFATGPGSLMGPSRIVHAISPFYRAPMHTTSMQATVASILDAARDVPSVAIPLLGAGIYRWPESEVAPLVLDQVRQWVTVNGARVALRCVRLFDNRRPAIDALVRALHVQQAATPVRQPRRQWEWETQGRWIEYAPAQCLAIDDAFERGDVRVRIHPASDSRQVAPGSASPAYDVILLPGDMCQQNTVSKFRRRVRYVTIGGGGQAPDVGMPHVPAAPAPTALAPPAPAAAAAGGGTGDRAVADGTGAGHAINVCGRPGDLDAMAAELAATLRDEESASAPVEVTTLRSMSTGGMLREAEDAVAACGAELTRQSEAGLLSVVIHAIGEAMMDAARTALDRVFLKWLQSDHAAQGKDVPSTWTVARSFAAKPAIVPVPKGTPEFANAVKWFTENTKDPSRKFGGTVEEVERVENPLAWRRFQNMRALVADELRRSAADVELVRMKHGTSSKDPNEICLTDTGLDFRFSGSQCFYGRALYLAEDAEYSMTYSHSAGDGKLKMVLAVVICGNVDERPGKDSNIKRPKPHHHSVYGPVDTNFNAVMVYEVGLAYPEFIITFRPPQ